MEDFVKKIGVGAPIYMAAKAGLACQNIIFSITVNIYGFNIRANVCP